MESILFVTFYWITTILQIWYKEEKNLLKIKPGGIRTGLPLIQHHFSIYSTTWQATFSSISNRKSLFNQNTVVINYGDILFVIYHKHVSDG